jgi:hydroxypyruvate isomerase
VKLANTLVPASQKAIMKNHHTQLSLSQRVCSRRTVLRGIAGAAALGAAWPLVGRCSAAGLRGHVKHSVSYWCYEDYLRRTKTSLDQFAAACVELGIKSIELTTPDQWPTLKKHGLICGMSLSHSIPKGLNRLENHDECLAKLRKSIDATSQAGFPNVVTLSGNRDGMDDQEGLKNCVVGLKKIAGYAEQKKVTVCLELLNSAVDHKDYMGDSTKWCVEAVHRVASPRVKVLYDIYHAAVMKEDVLADIRNHHDCFAHYHTGGVPGRNEIDSTQTVDYPKMVRAILATGYTGYIGQEFVPKRPDAMRSLEQAIHICDI